MKTLKKTLCLVLAVVMVVGVLIIPANAVEYKDLTDETEIKNKEAVAVLVGLGILSGDEGGFRPGDSLSRAEGAKIISYLVQTPAVAAKYEGATTAFTDVAGHWGINSITYCVDNEYVSGNGDGTFAPDDELTGDAFAKMLLCALGYNAKNEGFEGTGWEKNVETVGRKAGLFAGLSTVKFSEPLTRDNAAQMAYNALSIEMMDYVPGSGTQIILPDGTVIREGATRDPQTAKFNDATHYNISRLTGAAAGKDTYGRPYALTITAGTKTLYQVKATPLATFSGETFDIAVDLKDYKTDGTTAISMTTPVTYNNFNFLLDPNGRTGLAWFEGANGATIEIYGADKTHVTDIVVIEATPAIIKANANNVITLGILNQAAGATTDVTINDTTNKDLLNTFKGYAAGTVLALDLKSGYDANATNIKDYVLGVHETTSVTGKVTSVSSHGSSILRNETVGIAGTAYKTANLYSQVDYVYGQTYIFNEYNGYVIHAADPASATPEATAQLAYVLKLVKDAGDPFATTETYSAQVLKPDGSTAIVPVVNGTGDKQVYSGSASTVDGTFVAYTVNETTGAWTMTKLSTEQTINNVKYKADPLDASKTFTVTTGSTEVSFDETEYYATAATTFIVKADNKYTIYTGYNAVPSIETEGTMAGNEASVVVSDSFIVVMLIDVDGTKVKFSDDTAASLTYIVADKTATKVQDEKGEYRVFDAIVEGQKTTVMVAESALTSETSNLKSLVDTSATDVLAKSVTTNEKGLITKVVKEENGTQASAIKAVKNGLIGLDSKWLPTASDCAVFTVKSGTITATALADVKDTTATVYYSVDSYTNEVYLIIIVVAA